MAYKKIKSLRIVCLGGGIGTSNLIKGLKKYNPHITVVTSMADDGGSSGRLRKAYDIMPPGDMISCIAALIDDTNTELASLLTYRFPGNSKEEKILDDHKLGNLIMLAEILRTKNIYKALAVVKEMFGVNADIFPASDVRTHLSAMTKDGRRIHGETALKVARQGELYGIKKIYITPKNPKINLNIIKNIKKADIIISGPGDLYTNQLPVLIIPQIKNAVNNSKAKKIFILNIANKPFETKGFTLLDFVNAIKTHIGQFPFETVIANNNFKIKIPSRYKNYKYIYKDKNTNDENYKIFFASLIDKDFPVYHDPMKLAKIVYKNI